MATKKTLKIKNTSCLILKRDCFEVLAVSFQKSIKSFLLQLFLFLLLLTLSSSLLFFFFLYYLFDFIFNLSYYMIFCLSIILLFSIYFSFLLFISYFKFIFVPFSSFIFLLPFSFPFVLKMSQPSGASFACHYFKFYPYWPFVKPPRRTTRPSKLPRKLKSLLPLLLFYYRS